MVGKIYSRAYVMLTSEANQECQVFLFNAGKGYGSLDKGGTDVFVR